MNRALAPVLGKTCMVYMDDILVFSRDPAEHAAHLEEVLKLLRANKLFAKMSKCSFAQPQTSFLGHVVSAAGISVDPKKIAVLVNWPTPQNVGHVRSFLGLATYFRKFCEHFSTRADALHRLLRKQSDDDPKAPRTWVWDTAAKNAFQDLKTALSTAPIRRPPNQD